MRLCIERKKKEHELLKQGNETVNCETGKVAQEQEQSKKKEGEGEGQRETGGQEVACTVSRRLPVLLVAVCVFCMLCQ